jgi:hypothetical protein
MKTRNKANEKEVRWLDYVVIAIGGTQWKSIFDVRERFDAILPPEAVHRKARMYSFRARSGGRLEVSTIHSQKLTTVGSAIRYGVRHGYIERSIPIRRKSGNIGNHYLRLTLKGEERLSRIRFYLCIDCLNTGLTRPRKPEHAICGHCRRRHLTFYTPFK